MQQFWTIFVGSCMSLAEGNMGRSQLLDLCQHVDAPVSYDTRFPIASLPKGGLVVVASPPRGFGTDPSKGFDTDRLVACLKSALSAVLVVR